MRRYDYDEKMQAVENAIGYRFRNRALLLQAFTRPSYVNEHKDTLDYQVLEYYGDKMLSVSVNRALFGVFSVMSDRGLESTLKEGDYSAYHAALTNKSYLAERMRSLSLGSFLRMGEGDKKSGADQVDSVLEDLLESIVGAIAIDSGDDLSVLTSFVLRVLDIEDFVKTSQGKRHISAKNDLQELLQGAGYALPLYTDVKNADDTFTVTCFVKELGFSIVAEGKIIKEAELAAAAAAVSRLSAMGIGKATRVSDQPNAVSKLNEYAQKKKLTVRYRTVSDVILSDNTHRFTVSVSVADTVAEGHGKTVNEAKRAAAEAILMRLMP